MTRFRRLALGTMLANVLEVNTGPIQKKEYGFRYIGNGSLILRGAITSKNYCFREKGAILTVDQRDAPSLMAEPWLETIAIKR